MDEGATQTRPRPRGPRERRLLTSVQLERLYANYVVPIYRFIFARVGNRQDAEDLTSQVFMKGYEYIDPSASSPEIEAYLYRIARTDIADYWRRFASLRLVPIDETPAAFQAEEPDRKSLSSDLDALKGQLELILAELPQNYRRVLELRFFHCYSIKETARSMSITEANAKVLQHRAIHRAAAFARGERPASHD